MEFGVCWRFELCHRLQYDIVHEARTGTFGMESGVYVDRSHWQSYRYVDGAQEIWGNWKMISQKKWNKSDSAPRRPTFVFCSLRCTRSSVHSLMTAKKSGRTTCGRCHDCSCAEPAIGHASKRLKRPINVGWTAKILTMEIRKIHYIIPKG